MIVKAILRSSLILLISNIAFSKPCFEKSLSFIDTSIGVTAFEDCDDQNIAYILPQDFVINEGTFSGRKSFQWRENPATGGALAQLILKLTVDDQRLTRAMKDLRKNYQRRFTFKPLQIQNIVVTGFQEFDGVVAQTIGSVPSDTNGVFSIRLELDEDGKFLWEDSALWEWWQLESAKLEYEYFASDVFGFDTWIKAEHALFFDSLPGCVILGDCEDSDTTRKLVDQGRFFGAHYFHTQYLNCTDFLGASFIQPTLIDVSDTTLTSSEKEVVLLAAVDGFEQEKSVVESSCRVFLEEEKGKVWFNNLAIDNNYNCNNKYLWSFSTISQRLSFSSAEFINGARSAWQEKWNDCSSEGEAICDERKGDSWCEATLPARGLMCFSSFAVSQNVGFDIGSCQLSVFERIPVLNEFFFKTTEAFSLDELKASDKCVSFSGSYSSRNDYKVKVHCKESN